MSERDRVRGEGSSRGQDRHESRRSDRDDNYHRSESRVYRERSKSPSDRWRSNTYRSKDRSQSRGRDRDSVRIRERRGHRSRSASRERHRESDRDRRRRHASTASGSSSESETDTDEERRRRRRERRREEEKEDRRRRKEKKRLKKEKKKGTVALTAQWGKYGIISDADIGNKDSEFRAWLVEERKINPETLSKDRTRKEFAVFVEDYNTATLPHEKFYDMRKYDIRMNMIRSGQVIAAEDDKYDPLADVKAHNSTIKSQSAKKESVLSRAELEELRRIEAERVEIAKRRQLGLDVPRHLGVRTEQVTEFTFE